MCFCCLWTWVTLCNAPRILVSCPFARRCIRIGHSTTGTCGVFVCGNVTSTNCISMIVFKFSKLEIFIQNAWDPFVHLCTIQPNHLKEEQNPLTGGIVPDQERCRRLSIMIRTIVRVKRVDTMTVAANGKTFASYSRAVERLQELTSCIQAHVCLNRFGWDLHYYYASNIHDLQSNYDTIKRPDEDARNATSHSTISTTTAASMLFRRMSVARCCGWASRNDRTTVHTHTHTVHNDGE